MPRIKRPHSIVVKVTAEERDAFYRASSKLKLSGSDWLRGLGMREIDYATHQKTSVPNPDYVNAKPDGVLMTFDSNGEISTVSDMVNPITEPNMFISSTTSEEVKMNITPKPPTAEQRMYQVIATKQGKAAADAWLKSRQKPAPAVIGEPQVPGHLRAFYDNLVKNQGQAQADFWLLTNTKGVKLAP